jgi:hypothetical protein
VHKADYKKGKNLSIYPYFKKFGIENFKIILIKEYQVEDKAHRGAYEQLWINKLKPINKKCALNLLKKEKIKKYKSSEKYKKYMREYRKKHYRKNIEKETKYKKEYYEKNKEKMRELGKKWKEENKENFRKYRAQKRPCSQCGKLLSISSLSNHKKKLVKKGNYR